MAILYYWLLSIPLFLGGLFFIPFVWFFLAFSGACHPVSLIGGKIRILFLKLIAALRIQFGGLLFRGRRYGDELAERQLEEDSLSHSSVHWRTGISPSDEDGAGPVPAGAELLDYLGALLGYSASYSASVLDLFQSLALAAHTRLGLPLDFEHLSTLFLIRLVDLLILLARFRMPHVLFAPLLPALFLFGLGSGDALYFQIFRSLGLLQFDFTIYTLYLLWSILASTLLIRHLFPSFHHNLFGHPLYVPGHRDPFLFNGPLDLETHLWDYRHHQLDDTFDRDDLQSTPLATGGYGREGRIDDTSFYPRDMIFNHYSLPIDFDMHVEFPQMPTLSPSYHFLFSQGLTDLNQFPFRPGAGLVGPHFSYFFLNFDRKSLAQFSDPLSTIRPLRSALIHHPLRNFQSLHSLSIYATPAFLCDIRGFDRFRLFSEDYIPRLRPMQLEATGPDFLRVLGGNPLSLLLFRFISALWPRFGDSALDFFWRVRHRFYLSYSLCFLSLHRDLFLARWFPLALGDSPLPPFLLFGLRYAREFQLGSDFPRKPTTYQYWRYNFNPGSGIEIAFRSEFRLSQIDPYLQVARQSAIFGGSDPISHSALLGSRRYATGLLLASVDFLRKLSARERGLLLFRLGLQERGGPSSHSVQQFLESANLPDSSDLEDNPPAEPLSFYLLYIVLLGYEAWARSAHGLLRNFDSKLLAANARLGAAVPESQQFDFTPGLRHGGFRRRLYVDSMEIANERLTPLQSHGHPSFRYPFHQPGTLRFRSRSSPDIPRFLRIHPFGGYAPGDVSHFFGGGPLGIFYSFSSPESSPAERDVIVEQLRHVRYFELLTDSRGLRFSFPRRQLPLEYVSPRGYSKGHFKALRSVRRYGWNRYFNPFGPLADFIPNQFYQAEMLPQWYSIMGLEVRFSEMMCRRPFNHDFSPYITYGTTPLNPNLIHKHGTMLFHGHYGHFTSSLLAPRSKHRYHPADRADFLPFPFPLPLRGFDSPLGYHSNAYIRFPGRPQFQSSDDSFAGEFSLESPIPRLTEFHSLFRFPSYFFYRPKFNPRRHGPALKPPFQWVVSDSFPRYPSTEDLSLGVNDFYTALGTGRRGVPFDYTSFRPEYSRSSAKAPFNWETEEDLFSSGLDSRLSSEHGGFLRHLGAIRARYYMQDLNFFARNPNWEFQPPSLAGERKRVGFSPFLYPPRRPRFNPVSDSYLEIHPRALLSRGIFYSNPLRPRHTYRVRSYAYPYVKELTHVTQRLHTVFRGYYDFKIIRNGLSQYFTNPTSHLYASGWETDRPPVSPIGKLRHWDSLRHQWIGELLGEGRLASANGRRSFLQSNATSSFRFHSADSLMSDYYPPIRAALSTWDLPKFGWASPSEIYSGHSFFPFPMAPAARSDSFEKFFRSGPLRISRDHGILYAFHAGSSTSPSRLHALGLPRGKLYSSRRTGSDRLLLFGREGRFGRMRWAPYFSRIHSVSYRAGYGRYGAISQSLLELPDLGQFPRSYIRFLLGPFPPSHWTLFHQRLIAPFGEAGGSPQPFDRPAAPRKLHGLWEEYRDGLPFFPEDPSKEGSKLSVNSPESERFKNLISNVHYLARPNLRRNFRSRLAFLNDLSSFDRKYFYLRRRPMPSAGASLTYSPAFHSYLELAKLEPETFRRSRALGTAFTSSKFLLSRGFLGNIPRVTPSSAQEFLDPHAAYTSPGSYFLRLWSSLPYLGISRGRSRITWGLATGRYELTGLQVGALQVSADPNYATFPTIMGFDPSRQPTPLARTLGHLRFNRVATLWLSPNTGNFGSIGQFDHLRCGSARWPSFSANFREPQLHLVGHPALRQLEPDFLLFRRRRYERGSYFTLRAMDARRRLRSASRISGEFPASFYDGMRDPHYLTYGQSAVRGLDLRFLRRPFRWDLISGGGDTALGSSIREFIFGQGFGLVSMFFHNLMDYYNLLYLFSSCFALLVTSPLLIAFYQLILIFHPTLPFDPVLFPFYPSDYVEFIGFLFHLSIDFLVNFVSR